MTTTAMPELPELPRCDYPNMQYQRRYVGNLYTADQMRAYALATLQAQPAAEMSVAEIDRILSTPIPGGSVASHWFLPHDTDKGLANVRDVVRAMLTSARAILALRPQAVPMTDEQRQQAFNKSWATSSDFFAGIEAVEAHYGIAAPAGGEG